MGKAGAASWAGACVSDGGHRVYGGWVGSKERGWAMGDGFVCLQQNASTTSWWGIRWRSPSWLLGEEAGRLPAVGAGGCSETPASQLPPPQTKPRQWAEDMGKERGMHVSKPEMGEEKRKAGIVPSILRERRARLASLADHGRTMMAAVAMRQCGRKNGGSAGKGSHGDMGSAYWRWQGVMGNN